MIDRTTGNPNANRNRNGNRYRNRAAAETEKSNRSVIANREQTQKLYIETATDIDMETAVGTELDTENKTEIVSESERSNKCYNVRLALAPKVLFHTDDATVRHRTFV